MTTYFYQYFNIFEVCMTKFIDFNVFTKNFFDKPIENPLDLSKGREVNPSNNPLLEEYLPEDEAMREQLEEEFEESEKDDLLDKEKVPDKEDLQKDTDMLS